jgi:purine-binding chemotaxis protein CheW
MNEPQASPRGAAIVPASDTADAPILYVVFVVEGTTFALPASLVLQMETFTGATSVPGTPPWVSGIIQLRGRVIPVVDLRARFGVAPAERTMDTRVVVGEQDGRVVALVADSAREVTRIAPSQLKPPPRLVDLGARGFIRAVVQQGERTIMVLDFAKVIGEEPIDV